MADPSDDTKPGTPTARFRLLMEQLEQRFPDPEPFRSDEVPEARVLRAIDSLREQCDAHRSQMAAKEKRHGEEKHHLREQLHAALSRVEKAETERDQAHNDRADLRRRIDLMRDFNP